MLVNICSVFPSRYAPTVFLPETSIFPEFSIVLAIPETFLEYIPSDSSPVSFIEALFLMFEFIPMIPLDLCEIPSIKVPSDTKLALFPYIPAEFCPRIILFQFLNWEFPLMYAATPLLETFISFCAIVTILLFINSIGSEYVCSVPPIL